MLLAKNCFPCSFGPPNIRCATQQMLSPQHQMQQQQQQQGYVNMPSPNPLYESQSRPPAPQLLQSEQSPPANARSPAYAHHTNGFNNQAASIPDPWGGVNLHSSNNHGLYRSYDGILQQPEQMRWQDLDVMRRNQHEALRLSQSDLRISQSDLRISQSDLRISQSDHRMSQTEVRSLQPDPRMMQTDMTMDLRKSQSDVRMNMMRIPDPAMNSPQTSVSHSNQLEAMGMGPNQVFASPSLSTAFANANLGASNLSILSPGGLSPKARSLTTPSPAKTPAINRLRANEAAEGSPAGVSPAGKSPRMRPLIQISSAPRIINPALQQV
jgi:hypothetical protein